MFAVWKHLSITRKFALLYALLVALIALLTGVVYFNVGQMGTDADRLLEETREHVVAQRMVAKLGVIESLGREGAFRVGGDLSKRTHAERELEDLFSLLGGMGGQSDDPSRPEHQAEEGRYIDAAMKEITALQRELLQEKRGTASTDLDRPLGAVRDCLKFFVEETREEVGLSDSDLESSARAARYITVGTVLASAFALCLSLVLVYRTIILPIRKLREGADHIRAGNLNERIDLEHDDELGQLAASFNAMAQRIQETQLELEDRIAQRTRELIRAGRLADIGTLAAGVAHEINTPLASISACAEGLGRKIKRGQLKGDDIDEYLGTIRSEAERAHQTTQQLLALARQDHGKVGRFDLQLVLKQVEMTVTPLLHKRGVQLELRFDAGRVEPVANPGELTQVLVNLILNANDASPDGSIVELHCHHSDSKLIFDVMDHGCGIGDEDQDRIFSPFFTTKGPGEGTGLGLSLVANIVEHRSGRISVSSELGSWTRFRVEFPMKWKEQS